MAHIVAGHVDNDLDGAGVCGPLPRDGREGRPTREAGLGSDALAAGIRGAVEHGARVINLRSARTRARRPRRP